MNAARLARRWAEAGDNRMAMAEALADELAADLATKADLTSVTAQLREEAERTRGELLAAMERTRGELLAEVQRSRGDTLKWVAGLLLVHAIGVVGLTAGLVRLLAAG